VIQSMQQRQIARFEGFARAWAGIGATTAAEPVYASLVAAYEEPHRRYNTLEHIESCLAWLDWCWSLAEHPHEIAIALWFHDAVYDPLARDNEAKSAAWATRALLDAGVDMQITRRIEAMVLATSAHVGSTPDEALMLSIDLAILGASPAAYARFERDVREEYRDVPDAAYAAGRARVLTSLASATPLYATPAIAAELERKARKNLARAIASLSQMRARSDDATKHVAD
jgi:predicted metal-dependent HD superfamily phosphohydrolase